jgi:hypothetical protein
MSEIHYVTVKTIGSDSDDCMVTPFSCGRAAFAFAVECAELLDKQAWVDAVCDKDGRISDALNDWNDKVGWCCSGSDTDCPCVTVSTEFTRDTIRDFCRSCADEG